MALEAQNNPFTSVLMVGAADPEALGDADPSAGSYRLVMGDDDVLYILDSTGTATAVGGASGAVATDAIWDAAGDLAVGSGANTAAKLAIGATNGMALRRVSGAVAWDLPPGHEFDYVEITSPVSITGTTEGGATTVVTANAVTYDGSTAIILSFYADYLENPASGATDTIVQFFDGSTAIGIVALVSSPSSATTPRAPVYGERRITPSAASHTYSVRAFKSNGTPVVGAGAGGASSAHLPAFIRQVKV